jgi:hypothetical protein
MLTITIPETELFDDSTQTFSVLPETELQLEHSLFSLSKWESEFEKPFLSNAEKTPEEILGYAYHMIIPPGVSRLIVLGMTQDNLTQINQYIEAKHTATTFSQIPAKTGRGEVITAELLYYWMIAFNVPFECQHWHLNRLFALIRICSIKNQPQKKMSRNEIAARNRELNAQRKAQLGTRG